MKVNIDQEVDIPDDVVDIIHRKVHTQIRTAGTYADSRDPRESSTLDEKKLIAKIIAEYQKWAELSLRV